MPSSEAGAGAVEEVLAVAKRDLTSFPLPPDVRVLVELVG